MDQPYQFTSPCKSCPYRLDTKLKVWSVEEFKDLIKNEDSELGAIYDCHKKDGNICVGWLMDQDKRRLPSIMLRLSLSKNDPGEEYFDSLKAPSGTYNSYLEMCQANYPEVFIKKKESD